MSLSHTARSLRTALGRWVRSRHGRARTGCDAPATRDFGSRHLILRGWAQDCDEVRVHIPGRDPAAATMRLYRPDHPDAGFLVRIAEAPDVTRVKIEFRREGRTVRRIRRTFERVLRPAAPPPAAIAPPGGAAPSAAILIPSGGSVPALERNLKALHSRTRYPHFTVTVIDNSRGGAIRALAGRHGAEWLDWRGRSFDFAAMNNAAARTRKEDLLVFLNDDVEAVRPEWLAALAAWAADPRIGAAGARLLYPSGLVQHAGIERAPDGLYRNAFRFADPLDEELLPWLDRARPVPAVTGACLAVRRDLFLAAGGFDEQRFPVAFNDVDLCLRLGGQGLAHVYVPEAELYHFEALSKNALDYHARPREVAAFLARWPPRGGVAN